MPTVLVAGSIHESGLRVLRETAELDLDYVADASPDAYLSRLPRADALLIRTQPLDDARIAMAERLKIVSRHGVGYDTVDVAALSRRAIPLTVVGDVNSRSVAEHAMMLLLAAAKSLPRADAAVRGGDWGYRNLCEPREVFGKRLLIVGFGRTGRNFAALAQAFGLRIEVYDPFVTPGDTGVTIAGDLVAALATADYVSIHAPPSHAPLIGPREIAAMKRGAVIINTARGGVIDEVALMAALHRGHIAGAGLDVFETEPLPAGAPLSRLDRVVLTPHLAGLTQECAARMAVAAAHNIVGFFSGNLDRSLVVNARACGLLDAAQDSQT